MTYHLLSGEGYLWADVFSTHRLGVMGNDGTDSVEITRASQPGTFAIQATSYPGGGADPHIARAYLTRDDLVSVRDAINTILAESP